MPESAFQPQIDSAGYKIGKYLTLERFISYFYQISETVKFGVETVLEIGIGNGLVTACLRQLGIRVTTCDFDASVRPDVVADVRKIPLPDASVDLVMACQVLEHLPFAAFDEALQELARISKKYAIISLPRRHMAFEAVLKFPGTRTLFRRPFLNPSIVIPLRFPGFAESGQHHWEIDHWTVSLAEVKEKMGRHFQIRRVFSPPLNKYHVFFLLEKKEDHGS